MSKRDGRCVPVPAAAAPGAPRDVSGLALPPTFAALRYRNYRLLFSGQLISLTGAWMQWTALSWLVYELTKSPLLLGVVGAAGQFPTLLFSLPGGALADRFAKRRILLTTQGISMALAFGLGALALTPWIKAWHVAVLSALGGTVFAFDMPARQAFVAEIVGQEDLLNAMALTTGSYNVARLVGPAIAGMVVAQVGPAACFFANAVTLSAPIVALLLMCPQDQVSHPRERSILTQVWSGLRYVREEPRLLSSLLLLGVVGVFTWSYVVLMPVFAKDVLSGGAPEMGWLMSAAGVGAVIGSLTVASLGNYPRKHLLTLLGLTVFTAGVFGFSASPWLLLSLAVLAVGGWGSVVFLSTVSALVQANAGEEMRGRVMGVWSLVFGGSTPVSSLLAGAIAQRLGAPAATAIGAAGGALAAVAINAAFARAWLEPRHEAG